jgi:hypothetical protein
VTVFLREHYRARAPYAEAVCLVLDRIWCEKATTTDKELLRSQAFGYPGGPDLLEGEEWRMGIDHHKE